MVVRRKRTPIGTRSSRHRDAITARITKGMTERQQFIAQELCSGRTLTEIANYLEITLNAVKDMREKPAVKQYISELMAIREADLALTHRAVKVNILGVLNKAVNLTNNALNQIEKAKSELEHKDFLLAVDKEFGDRGGHPAVRSIQSKTAVVNISDGSVQQLMQNNQNYRTRVAVVQEAVVVEEEEDNQGFENGSQAGGVG